MTVLERRLIRNFERRMGKSMLPLVIKHTGEGIWRVFDPETGSWVQYTIDHGPTGRLRRLNERDNA